MNEGTNTEDDLFYPQFEDLQKGTPVVKRINLNIIRQYLSIGYVLNRTTDMNTTQTRIIQGQVAGNFSVVGQRAPDKNHGSPKIHTNTLPDYSGDSVNYKLREREYGSIIKKPVYKTLVKQPAYSGDANEEERSIELFNIIISCVGSGNALNMVDKFCDNNNGKECGHYACKDLK